MSKNKNKKNHKKASANVGKRRPHLEIEEGMIEGEVLDGAEAINTEAQNEGVSAAESENFTAVSNEELTETAANDTESAYESSSTEDFESTEEQREKTHLNFYGSEIIRQKAPKVMEIADTVADEWAQDGRFEGLPLGNPLAQIAAAKALRKAKDVEKKLEEKGVFMMARIGVDFLKSKINKR